MPPAKNTPSKPEKDETPSVPTQEVPEVHDDTDVEAALKRKTADGPGTDPVPPADFESFATKDVEKKDLLSVAEVTQQVLDGRWGNSVATAKNRLEAAGYDVDLVAEEYARRKQGGAPSAF